MQTEGTPHNNYDNATLAPAFRVSVQKMPLSTMSHCLYRNETDVPSRDLQLRNYYGIS